MQICEMKQLLSSGEYDFLVDRPELGDNIILLGVGGSHAYGTNVEGSDLDIRGVAVNTARNIITNSLFEQSVDSATDTTMLIDKQSGKDFERPAYTQLMKKLRQGDVLVVKSIDRLGRNYEEILEQWRVVTKDKQAAIVVLDMPLLDTRSNRDLTGTLIADIVLQLLSYVAETERIFIHQRQREGIEAAHARGQRFGRPPKKRPPELEDYVVLWADGKISAREAARKLHLVHTTFLTWAREILMDRGYSNCERGMHPTAPTRAQD